MHVQKRNGSTESISFNKVLQRIRKAAKGLAVNPDGLAQQVLARIVNGIKTSDLDELAAQMSASLCTTHEDWGTLASRIAVSNHQKNTETAFTKVVQILSNQFHKTGDSLSYLSADLVAFVEANGPAIDAYINHERDYDFDYFGFKTLEKSYLLKDTAGKVIERPQHMWMRVAVGIWMSGKDPLPRIFETYDLLSQKFMTHATPTLFNAGTPRPQLSSCYLLAMANDSIAGIYKTLGDCAAISKYAGGIGLHLHNVRARGSLIRGTNGQSNGLIPMLRVFNNTARYVDQCFTPDTIIYTLNGPKTIETVSITDKVLSSTGVYESVRLPIRHEYSGPILDIQIKNAIYPVRTTPEHQIFALKGQVKGLNFDVIRNRLDKGITAPEFSDARDLNVGDFLVFPIPSYVNEIESISEEDCRFYGIMLGDGHISGASAGVCLNIKTKNEVLEFVRNYLQNRGIHLYEYPEEDSSTIRVKWSTTSPGFKFTHSQIYDENKQKKIDTPFLHLSLNKIKQLLRGLIETDGCVGTKEIAIELSSYPLIESIRYLLLRLGTLSSGYERNRVGDVSSSKNIHTNLPTAVVRVPRIREILEMFPNAPAGEFFSYLTHNNNLYSRIETITETTYSGLVHDFEIDGTHDYTVAHLGIVHNGGGKRNGSFAMYLEPWHADVEDFLRMKLNTGAEEERARDLFYALWIPDLFMKRVETDADWSLFCPDEAPGLADVWGDAFEELYTSYEAKGRARKTVSARKLWFQILDSQMETGTPYLLYKDAANSKSNQMNIGTIKSSNLCVAPETYILTDKGHVQIHELENQFVNVWNGEKWSNTQICKTGVQQKLVTVRLSNGAEIHCTPYHKFIIRESYSDHKSLKDAVRVPASELQEGMKLAKYDLAVIEGNPDNDFNHPYTHGFFCGDGTTTGIHKRKICSLYGVKKELVPHLAIQSMSGKEDAIGRLNVVLDQSIPDKFEVPTNSSIRCRLEWLAGLFDADGTVVTNGGNESLQLASIHLDFLDRIRLMLQTLGVQSKVVKSFDERQTLLPDGHGGRKLFDCKPLWRILISSSSLYRLYNLGFRCHRLTFTAAKPQRNAEQFVTVLSVVDYERFDDTYCFNEPENHAGVFNGVLTGNCTEIMEVSTPEETAVCNLASLALPAFVKEGVFDFETLRNTVKVAVRNLNQIIDINFYPTPETKVSNMRHRPIGIGVQGLADVFAMLGIAWESPAAADLNKRIFEHLYYAAVEESAALASTEGSYETFVGSPASKGMLQPDLWSVAPLTQEDETLDWTALRQKAARGLRNSLLVAPMPTASTSQILGYNECFEPFTSNIYTRRTLAGEFIVINRHLMRELMSLGLWNDDMKQQIIVNNGSIQSLDAPAEVRARYKTTWEIPQKILIDMAADRGAFICQSQSLNLFVADPNYAKLTSMHFYGWKKGLKTGCYYLRTKAPVAAQKFTVDPRLLAAVAGGSAPVNQEDTDEEASDDETSDDEKPVKPQETRKEKLERLSREYEEEVARSKAAADAGEGCLLCSS